MGCPYFYFNIHLTQPRPPQRPKRLTDRTLPPGLASIAPDANLFSELLEAEKKLDWTLSRKRQEVKDATSKDLTVGGIGCPISAKS